MDTKQLRRFAKEKADSYQSVVRAVFGRGMELFMILSIALYSFGSCIAFLVIIGDQFVPIIQEFLFVRPLPKGI